ncbi:hypothetical protein GIB67_033548 [Kingdonia uniflora]|uniref:Uncharacterized protein n=1 Tax=Kingdonia uniflora TaxID=39325 RepID=A0A7J7L6D5_9MAGN|nr:hypothetical protein GIB67_033548 [Kingdonia uniflora]
MEFYLNWETANNPHWTSLTEMKLKRKTSNKHRSHKGRRPYEGYATLNPPFEKILSMKVRGWCSRGLTHSLRLHLVECA